jgi:hypothetical protein
MHTWPWMKMQQGAGTRPQPGTVLYCQIEERQLRHRRPIRSNSNSNSLQAHACMRPAPIYIQHTHACKQCNQSHSYWIITYAYSDDPHHYCPSCLPYIDSHHHSITVYSSDDVRLALGQGFPKPPYTHPPTQI